MRVDHACHIGPALVDREVQSDLAEHLAAADDLPLGVELDDVALLDQALRGRRGRREVARTIAGGDVAVVVGNPSELVQQPRCFRDLRAQLHRVSTASTTPTMVDRIGTMSPCFKICRVPLPSVSTSTLSPTPACTVSIATKLAPA